ncbi:MAG: phosphodiester glycosidase family protein, partial [Chloroflexota bacterium]|nr:phosphodiester glycosidase family protein [Chloroflexota bacterium]
GQIILGAWGLDPRLNSGNSNLVAWRQNAALLINNGKINPLTQDGAAWGGTILNAAYTWRSGIGITAHGTLIYAAGSSLTALTLGEALKAAGAVMAMQTDINPFWVRAFLYNRNAGGTLSISKLNPAMYGTGTEYLSTTQRDFFYLTRYAPPLPPVRPREVPAQ